jgi:pimeloyl-ACP methyl ester carboxylesterase/predicted glycosyltransferase
MRAREPDRTGFVERGGVHLYYEVFGEGESTILFLPTWSVIHSRHWKAQLHYFARHLRVVTFDGRGNGRSDRPADPEAYAETEFAADTLAVLDATGTEEAVVVSLSLGAQRSLIVAAEHPRRVRGLVFLSPTVSLTPLPPERTAHSFTEPLATEEGWAKFNQHYWRRDYRGFLEFFFSQMFTEPHSTKQIEDCVGWGLETTPETLIAATISPRLNREETLALCERVRCPVLVIHGENDAISPSTRGEALAQATRGTLVLLEGAGHGVHARDPVKVNLLLRDFADRLHPERSSGTVRRWTRGSARRRRALFISSPIGLGHAQRDVALARELRRLVPDLEIDWLAQHPVTRVLESEGERVHPASAFLANESRHIEYESAEHDLHCFQAVRRMDEILIANFMVFHDLVREEPYDLWIGDEAWELDYFLHENPEQKRAAYVWLTDFVGWLPMGDGGAHEQFLTADYSAEMIGHIARYPRIRDRALFVGNPADIVPERFGPDLPLIREWTEEHYAFPGYISGFDPEALGEREALRHELGYWPDEKVCLVSVGGSGVGGHLLRKVIASLPEAKRRVPELRMIVVAGPRIDPVSLPTVKGLEVRSYVHNLYRHLFACDLAVVQGGLTTAMELTASRRPFLYFPLRHHFEQNFHVRHRLERYGAGRCMDYDAASPECIAEAIACEIGREVSYRPVETGGARRAAEMIAEIF